MFLFVCVCGEDWVREKLSGRVQPGDRYMNLDVKEGVGGGGLNVCVCMCVRRRLGKRKIVWASAA